MNIEEFRNYCLSFEGVTEEFPFGEETLVYKVLGKMFALATIEDFNRVNLKCDPEYAVQLREAHEDITAGWHMNKKHWNSVYTQSALSDELIKSLIDHSYECVTSKMSKKDRMNLGLD